VKAEGAAKVVGDALDWAHEANPEALLLYNDFNLSPAFEKLVGDLKAAGKPFGAIGIQSHMHHGEWPVERAWEVCETNARFELPLHFTEVTVLSGEQVGGTRSRPSRTNGRAPPRGRPARRRTSSASTGCSSATRRSRRSPGGT
jgi:GH35 family endo-1,4-beta-xylanase